MALLTPSNVCSICQMSNNIFLFQLLWLADLEIVKLLNPLLQAPLNLYMSVTSREISYMVGIL